MVRLSIKPLRLVSSVINSNGIGRWMPVISSQNTCQFYFSPYSPVQTLVKIQWYFDSKNLVSKASGLGRLLADSDLTSLIKLLHSHHMPMWSQYITLSVSVWLYCRQLEWCKLVAAIRPTWTLKLNMNYWTLDNIYDISVQYQQALQAFLDSAYWTVSHYVSQHTYGPAIIKLPKLP